MKRANSADNSGDLLRGNTPTLVLAVLQESAAHGYAIAKRINERAGPLLHMRQGTLYPVLYGLERDGLVAGQWEHSEGERPRKVYAITDAGRADLSKRKAEWLRFSTTVSGILGVNLEPG